MYKAALYRRCNQLQRKDTEKVTQENQLQWRLDGQDTLIDVGSGSGDALMDFIYPQLPKDFRLLMGIDISTNMVKYASENYDQDERVKFCVLDIGCEILPIELCEQFDHVTSFYCLHWVLNQCQAFYNIYKLLRCEGGDCLLLFVASAPIFDTYKMLSQLPKWAPIMQDVDDFISPLQYSEDAVEEVEKMLLQAGFIDCKVELRKRVHVFQNAEALKNFVDAICPFMRRLFLERQREFLNDVVKCFEQLKLRKFDVNSNDYEFHFSLNLIVAYARKPNIYFKNGIKREA